MDPIDKLQVSFHGSKKCYLVYYSNVDCGYKTCDGWTRYETIEYPDNRCCYGVIPLERADQVRTFDICQNQVLGMKLVPWSSRNNTQLSKATMAILGRNRTMKWQDSVVIDEEICSVSLEVFCPVDALAKAYERPWIGGGSSSSISMGARRAALIGVTSR